MLNSMMQRITSGFTSTRTHTEEFDQTHSSGERCRDPPHRDEIIQVEKYAGRPVESKETTTAKEAEVMDLSRYTETREQANRHLRQFHRENQLLREENQRQRHEIDVLKDEARRTEAHHAQTRELLDARTLELKGAQAFLTQADLMSGAEVIAMIEALNSEILQAAAWMTDSLRFRDGPMETKTKTKVDDVCGRAIRVLGSKMLNLLRSPTKRDLTLVQVALQCGLVLCCKAVIESWHFDDWSYAHFLTKIYDRIRQVEDQAVSGRWRAITRAFTGHISDDEHLLGFFVDNVVDVLIVAGWSGYGSNPKDVVRSEFGDRLSTIGKLAARLNKAIGEEIISGDLEVFVVRPETDFNPKHMENGYAEGLASICTPSIVEQVLCTSDMGLTKQSRPITSEGRRGCLEVVLLKPKVVLYSALTDMKYPGHGSQ